MLSDKGILNEHMICTIVGLYLREPVGEPVGESEDGAGPPPVGVGSFVAVKICDE